MTAAALDPQPEWLVQLDLDPEVEHVTLTCPTCSYLHRITRLAFERYYGDAIPCPGCHAIPTLPIGE